MDRHIQKITFSCFLFEIIYCNKNGNKNMMMIFQPHTGRNRIKTKAYNVQFEDVLRSFSFG